MKDGIPYCSKWKKGKRLWVTSPDLSGYVQYTSPKSVRTKQKESDFLVTVPSVQYKHSEALVYWRKELASKDRKTATCYYQYFKGFVDFIGLSPDEIIAQREQDPKNPETETTTAKQKHLT